MGVIFLIARTKDSTRARYSHKVFFMGPRMAPFRGLITCIKAPSYHNCREKLRHSHQPECLCVCAGVLLYVCRTLCSSVCVFVWWLYTSNDVAFEGFEGTCDVLFQSKYCYSVLSDWGWFDKFSFENKLLWRVFEIYVNVIAYVKNCEIIV